MKKNIRLVLIDDQELIRYGVRRMLEQEADLEVVGDYASPEEAFCQIVRINPDVVLLNAQMPGMSGIEAIRILKQRGLDFQGSVIMLSDSTENRMAALDAGATAYLLKDVSRAELVRTIREVYWNQVPSQEPDSTFDREVDLVLSSTTPAADLLRFTFRLGEALQDTYYATILRMVGSWNSGAVILPSHWGLVHFMTYLGG